MGFCPSMPRIARFSFASRQLVELDACRHIETTGFALPTLPLPEARADEFHGLHERAGCTAAWVVHAAEFVLHAARFIGHYPDTEGSC